MAYLYPDFCSFSSLIIAVAVVAVVWLLYRSSLLPHGFPPGPTPLPIFGNLLMIKKNNVLHRHKTFLKLSKVYGSIFGMKMGSIPVVVLNDLDVIEEALVKNAECFSRPHMLPIALHRSLKHGRPQSLWQRGDGVMPLRKITKDYLLEAGNLRDKVEQKIQEEVDVFCSELSKQSNKPISMKQLNKQAITDVLYSNIFGSRLEYNDTEFTNFITRIDTYTDEKTLGSIVNFFPVQQYLPFGKRLLEKITKNLTILDNFMAGELDEHKRKANPGVQKDLIDYFLHTKDDSSIEEDNFQRFALDLHVGTFGVFATLDWLWFLVARFPEIQRRCQGEIDRFIQKRFQSRSLELKDQEELPFVRATILETLRFVTPVPLTVPYETVSDVSIGGYRVPRDTLVMVNLYSVHMNQQYWDDPGQFNPARWITVDGQLDKALMNVNQGFVPFGVGRRDCVGKSLAEGELFLFFAKVMRDFEIKLEDPESPPPLAGDLRLTMQTQPHKVIVTPRSKQL